MNKIAVLMAAGLIVSVAVPAHAGPCSKEIEMVTQLLSGGGGGGSLPSPDSAGSALSSTESLSAVTGGAAAGALGSSGGASVPTATPEALDALEGAKTADAAGDETSCMEYIGQAKQLLGLVQ